MKTTPIAKAKQPLEVEPQNKSMEEEVRNIESMVGAEPQIIIQNESIKAIVE
jgi:hypothetical protein